MYKKKGNNFYFFNILDNSCIFIF